MEYSIDNLLDEMTQNNASDLHLTVGVSPVIRVDGSLVSHGEKVLLPDDINTFIKELLTEEQLMELNSTGEVDLCISKSRVGRFRLNVFKQRGSYAVAVRHVNTEVPDVEELGLPSVVKDIAGKTRGLFLVTGPTGSGKSTTLASIISLINSQRNCHIITLEDPIEYLHKHNKSIINQREIGTDSKSYSNALRAALREDPDVILIGEMRDLETISTALTAAETGHLVLSTLHTIGAAKTIDRIIDVFPPYQQQQIRVQLSTVLTGILSQILLPRVDKKGRVAAFEVMTANSAVRNLIRESKTHQIYSIIQTNQKEGMTTLDSQLIELCRNKIISQESALVYSSDSEFVTRSIQNKNIY